ncbi:DUF2946 family protein [Flagellatimonas centrodinii]|uniref:DUF2946 family protein n=1 Tax=Flagellatimonas centrodinii TaxID=2806210 RepID=UPI001FEFB808|nr:DUF2946 family protein [Flagellatimonas centrodinii]ULQ48065.1 DUF2946 family protein [Flagellatimonas centrodinii]
MDDTVRRALARWPNVPDLYGWLSLDRRGRWRIQGELISRPQILDLFDRRYQCDARGAWFIQNGPQRGFVDLEATPFILTVAAEGGWVAHTGQAAGMVRAVYLDDEGAVVLDTALGAGLVAESDLPSALECLVDADGAPINEAALEDALRVPSGQPTTLRWRQAGEEWAVRRIDRQDLPTALGFIQSPAPATAKPGKSHH